MCGRVEISNAKSAEWFKKKFGYVPDSSVNDNKNVCPTDLINVTTNTQPGILQQFRWSLIPANAYNLADLPIMINAKAETLLERKSFSKLVTTKRCIVIVDSWFEWYGKPKKQYAFKPKNQDIMVFAGLWDEWINRKTNDIIKSATVITVEANALVAEVHAKNRMPAILRDEEVDTWLMDGLSPQSYLDMLKTYPEDELLRTEVEPAKTLDLFSF